VRVAAVGVGKLKFGLSFDCGIEVLDGAVGVALALVGSTAIEIGKRILGGELDLCIPKTLSELMP
jgi:hypothetical protein